MHSHHLSVVLRKCLGQPTATERADLSLLVIRKSLRDSRCLRIHNGLGEREEKKDTNVLVRCISLNLFQRCGCLFNLAVWLITHAVSHQSPWLPAVLLEPDRMHQIVDESSGFASIATALRFCPHQNSYRLKSTLDTQSAQQARNKSVMN